MDYSPDIPLKVEKTDIDSDKNGNFRLRFHTEIKMEKDYVPADEDVSSFQNSDLLTPLFFKRVTEPEGPQCGLCYKYFSDRYAILKHNLTHLQVTIVNPVLYLCAHCACYSTNKLSMECHMTRHDQSLTNTLSNKRTTTADSVNKVLKIFKCIDRTDGVPKLRDDMTTCLSYKNKFKPKDHTKTYQDGFSKLEDGMTNSLSYRPKSLKTFKTEDCTKTYKDGVYKLTDGMTNWLSYRPKSSRPIKEYLKNSNKTHQCNICHKTYTYKNWHEHMQDVHSTGSLPCEICGAVFKCKRYLKRHLSQIHIRAKPRGAMKIDVKCDQCDTVLKSLNALATHLRNVHSDAKHVCYICKSTLKCKAYLLTHMRRLHCNDGKKHECECGKSFKSKRYLMVHKRNSHLKKGKKVDRKVEDTVLVD